MKKEKKLPKVYARHNWASGWIADCPECNAHLPEFDGTDTRVAEGVKPGEPFICSKCNPGLHAMMPVKFNNNVINVADFNLRQRAIEMAAEKGQVFEVVFPEEKEAIMSELRKRPPQNMNWHPGETVANLKRQNKKHLGGK